MPDESGHDRLSCAVQHPMQASHDASEVPALIALFAGALAIGSSGIFVRLSETGPTATAFWRGALALPLLAGWALLERRARAGAAQPEAAAVARSWRDPMFFWAGVFFAGDLALWHASLLLTTVAASTLEANCAPLVVTLGAWALWGERPRLSFLLTLALASVGLLLMVSTKFAHGPAALTGDLLGLGTAGFCGWRSRRSSCPTRRTAGCCSLAARCRRRCSARAWWRTRSSTCPPPSAPWDCTCSRSPRPLTRGCCCRSGSRHGRLPAGASCSARLRWHAARAALRCRTWRRCRPLSCSARRSSRARRATASRGDARRRSRDGRWRARRHPRASSSAARSAPAGRKLTAPRPLPGWQWDRR